MADYLIHKAVELDKVKTQRRLVLESPGYLEENYIAQAKYDGCNLILRIADARESCEARSRTGERVRSVDHILDAVHALGVPGVYLGEAWALDTDQPTISGLFRQHAAAPQLQLVLFDFLTLEEFDRGHSPLGYVARVERLPAVVGRIKQASAPVWLATSFGYLAELGWVGQDTCNKLVSTGGYDGLIFRDPDGTWTAGRGTTGEIIKLKQKVSYDLQVVDFELGKGKHAGKIGALLFRFNGGTQSGGTGLKDSERDPSKFADEHLGKIRRVECMGLTDDGWLREPRTKEVRYDKEEADA